MLTFTVSPGLALGIWYCDTSSPSPVINDNLHRWQYLRGAPCSPPRHRIHCDWHCHSHYYQLPL